ncbi:hypothetical protein OS493_003449 [Desmophyllum pertusum]|uniref:MAM domain-containing protein n=1 Tax=Desmophyllum pertusum TaxID=174260 RepID=A0A9X0A914_9CNID|nr:hypothetical protein OS493_003449 [Desmophyllum pertusum]
MYEVIIEGIRGSSYTGDMAIDDFKLVAGPCSSTFICNFDGSTCGFTQDTTDKFDWTRNKGNTSSFQTGPSSDHTTGQGYYMYTETSSPRNPGDVARLKGRCNSAGTCVLRYIIT